MKKILAVAPAMLLAACASTSSLMPSSSTTYWVGASSSIETFRRDNVVCSARAQKFGNVTTAPENSIDRPMQRWPNATAQDAYEACMSGYGWRAAG
jgi:hypothetical protein